MKMLNEEKKCPLCDSYELRQFVARSNIPAGQNIICTSYQGAISTRLANLDIVLCQNCGFIFNKSFDPLMLDYGDGYDNNQTCSPFFMEYIDQLVRYLIYCRSVKNCRIVEVGCGKGFFLKKLVEDPQYGNIGIGFDPSYEGPQEDFDGRLTFIKSYFGPEHAGIAADVVICRHVIEHVPDPIPFLTAISQVLIDSPSSKLFVETPCVEWILRQKNLFDFCYEHCSYFSQDSLAFALEAAGLQVETASQIFQGQYLWLEASLDPAKPPRRRPAIILNELATGFQAAENSLTAFWQKKIGYLTQKGKVAVWGAGGKGVTFVNLVDPGGQYINCLIDMNPNKQGNYVPGTGHLIISPQDINKHQIKYAILMNPNYKEEIINICQSNKTDIKLIDVMHLD